MNGKKLDVAGAGSPGKTGGAFEKAQFDDPQGMALSADGNILYVADRRNHMIRALDLKARTVTTIAGTGEQDRDRTESGPALERGLNSPWALYLDGDRLFIAMAGHHQIWTLDLKEKTLEPYAGDGRENIKDGPLFAARFAQPSGLTSDGKYLYVADPEVSAIRKVPMNGKGRVETLVGEGLFEFGDIDGPGKDARLQHAIGVAYHNGAVYVADTYNNKIKTIDLKSGDVATFLGGPEKKGEERLFNEPAGLSIAGEKLFVADTNAHRIRIIDLKTKAVSTLDLKGVEPVALAKE
jgi:sugar lactone lactonase YvrE